MLVIGVQQAGRLRSQHQPAQDHWRLSRLKDESRQAKAYLTLQPIGVLILQ